jgi:two-component system, LytTR family, response regulator LytT
MKILVVEDEQPAARRIIRLVKEQLPEVKEVVHLESVEDAVDFFNSGQKADLAFFDIQLADGLSFDIFSRCKVSSPVIFTTAYDEYALKAFKVNTVDYLLKPIEESELKNALDKYHEIYKTKETLLPDYSVLMDMIKNGTEKFKKRFLIKTGGRLTFVNAEDIAYFFSDEGTSFLVTQSKDRFILESTLEEVESSVNPLDFFRINRKMILRTSSIKKIESHFNNRFLLEVQPPFEEEVIVSRQRSAEFRVWLDS